MGSVEEKLKHSRRRKNHIAKDLRSPKFSQRVIEPYKKIKKLNKNEVEYENDEY